MAIDSLRDSGARVQTSVWLHLDSEQELPWLLRWVIKVISISIKPPSWQLAIMIMMVDHDGACRVKQINLRHSSQLQLWDRAHII